MIPTIDAISCSSTASPAGKAGLEPAPTITAGTASHRSEPSTAKYAEAATSLTLEACSKPQDINRRPGSVSAKHLHIPNVHALTAVRRGLWQ